jgi:hypothetical protein
MSLINNYYKPSTSEFRGYFPEGVSALVNSVSFNSSVNNIPNYLNKIFLLPFFIRKPIKDLRICLPIIDVQKDVSNNILAGTVTFGIYLPTDENKINGSKKIYETSLFNSTILPSAATHVLQNSWFIQAGWIYLAILIQGNAFTGRAYSSNLIRSILGAIPYTTSGQIKDISTALNSDGIYYAASSSYAVQVAKLGDLNYPSVNNDNSYTSLPDQINNYVEKAAIPIPLVYLIY